MMLIRDRKSNPHQMRGVDVGLAAAARSRRRRKAVATGNALVWLECEETLFVYCYIHDYQVSTFFTSSLTEKHSWVVS